jgi:hypothetical protein
MKRMIFILLILTVMLPVNAAAMTAPYVPPDSLENTPISLPFPVTDVPVGITFAALDIAWGENDTSTAPYWDAPYYPIDFTAEYTIRYDGDEPAVAEIAMPMLGMFKPEANIVVDGEPAELATYFSIVPLKYEEQIPLMAEYIDNMQSQAEPYEARYFDLDAPAKLYTFIQYGADKSGIGIDIILEYDPAETILLINAPFDMEPNINYGTYIDMGSDVEPSHRPRGYYYGEVRTVQIDKVALYDVLVVGNDTLSWRIREQYRPEESGSFSLSVSEPKNETPREFITRVQDEDVEFFDNFPRPVLPNDFLVRWVDQMLDLQSKMPSNVIHSFANVRCIDHIYSSDYCMFDLNDEYANRYIMRQQSFVTAVKFEPHEERVLRVAYRSVTGMEWNKAEMQSLFYSTILTEAVNYWEFFDALRITTNRPEDAIESAIPNGFIETDNSYVLDIQSVPKDNISIGFVMPDVRHDPPINWGLWLFFIFAIAVNYWPITLGIIIYIIYLVICRRHNKAEEKEAE